MKHSQEQRTQEHLPFHLSEDLMQFPSIRALVEQARSSLQQFTDVAEQHGQAAQGKLYEQDISRINADFTASLTENLRRILAIGAAHVAYHAQQARTLFGKVQDQ